MPAGMEKTRYPKKRKNKPPTASFTSSPPNPKTNQRVMFNSTSFDSDGTIDQYIWTFGDGSSSHRMLAQIQSGLSSSSINNLYLSLRRLKSVENIILVLSEEVQQGILSIPSGQGSDFFLVKTSDRGKSLEEPNTQPQIEMVSTISGRSQPKSDSLSENPTYTYSEPGTYKVKLTVTDEDGATDSPIKEVTVVNRTQFSSI